MKYLLLYMPWGLLRPTCSLTIILLLLLSCLAPEVLAQSVSKQDFDNLPWKLFYFQDSEVILWLDNIAHNVWRSHDLGRTWAKVSNVPENAATQLFDHPFDNNFAYILGDSTTHYKTIDKGVTWQSFKTLLPPTQSAPLSFHSERSNYVLYRGTKCEENGSSSDCHDETFYTIDNFATDPKLLLTYTDTCSWTRSTEKFKESPVKEIMCIEWPNKKSDFIRNPDSSRLVQSEDYFESIQPVNFETTAATGIVGFTGKGKFILAAAKAPGDSDDMSFYVTEDGERWAHAIFPSGSSVHQKAYTILESTNYALFVDVQTNPSVEIGALHISNSNGTFFTLSLPNTNRNSDGIVDFEKIQGVEGIMMANIVANPAGVAIGKPKQLRTRMSFDDGRKWSSIKHVVQKDGSQFPCNGQGEDCTLHLHSVTQSAKDLYSFGNVLSANGPVGFVMGVGNVGSHLLNYEDCNTFLSIDGGLNWKLVEEGPHKYEFGDMGSVLVLVNDKEATDYVIYSKNQGKDWQRLDLGITIRAHLLTSDPESTTAKFLLIGTIKGSGSDDKARSVQAIHLDFSNIFSRKCEDESSGKDLDKWYARDLTPGADCLMGHEQVFWRRKADAECYVGRKFKDPQVETKNCPCTAQDYECDFNFVEKEQGECKRAESWTIPKDQCKTKDSTFLSSSGYRKIPGNTCEGGLKLDDPVDLPCSTSEDFLQDPDEIFSYSKFFDTTIEQFLYFRNSTTILIRTKNNELFLTDDEGVTWTKLLEGNAILGFWLHEHDNKRGYVFTSELFFITLDQGKNWAETKLPAIPNRLPGTPILDSHPRKPDWLIFVGEKFDPTYRTVAYYSQDHGKTWTLFATFVSKCIFGRDEKFDGIELESILCSEFKYKSVEDPSNPIQLIKTTDWGKSQEVLFSDVVQFFVVEKFMAVATQLNGALVLHISTDGKTFEEARFPPNMNVDRNTFTILQSTTGSVLLNVFHSMKYGLEYGTLFKSDEKGANYNPALQHTNGDSSGLVDFEKMQGIDGIILANQVLNTEELNGGRDVSKKVRTMISWDDGGKWEPLKAPAGSSCETADCGLQLHSRTTIRGPGAIFTASSAPGLAMGVGNVGKYLLPYDQGNTFLTRDAGHTWTQVRPGEHLYEFGDQGTLLVLVNDEGPTDVLLYTWDQGKNWQEFKFSEEKVRVSVLTTDPKSVTLKFILIGHTLSSDQQNAQQVVITVDFSKTQLRQCVLAKNNPVRNDFEQWTPKDDDGDDACLLGRKVVYWRRKQDHACYVGGELQNGIDIIQKNCECRNNDFECDFGFWRDNNGECIPQGHHPDQPVPCTGPFQGRSGYRRISMSACEGGEDLTQKKSWECKNANDDVISTKMEFDGVVSEFIYFNDTDTVILHTSDSKVWQSINDGYSWTPLFNDVEILAIYQNPFFDERAYFITNGTTHYMTTDKARSTSIMAVTKGPAFSFPIAIMKFHAEEPDWIIYIGEDKCDSIYSQDCHTEAFYSKDGGKSWNPLTTYVRSCLWGRDVRFKTKDKDTIFCQQYYEKSGNQMMFGLSNPLQFVSTPDYYSSKKVLFDYIVGVAIFEQYMIIAELVDNGSSLKLSISLDGNVFAEAKFPPNWKLKHEAYTIMESVTSSVWLHVSTSTYLDREYGVIFTSNSNGTYFGLSLDNVNRNGQGIVDFEKMQGIEGIALANQVINTKEVNAGNPKKLKTMITFDDGASWRLLDKPALDPYGKPYDCKDCSLNLHSYSERRNPRDLFSHSSAVGLMVAVGNVGPSLTSYTEGDTFLTRDAGKTWKAVHDQAHLWEFGDQGALLLIVNDEEATDQVVYTADEGMTWSQYTFVKEGDKKVRVSDIITQPDGTSQKFVLLGKEVPSGKQVAYHIDFSGLRLKKCQLNLDDPSNDDFELWSPADTRGEPCLFGRETQYYRRIQGRDCYIGEKLLNLRKDIRNCTCASEDYECDFNYYRSDENKCVLYPGAQPLQPTCENGQDYFWEPTGYRKKPLSTCSGGDELDKKQRVYCEGKGSSGGKLALYLGVPFAAAGIIFGLFYYRKQARFGRIRLPDTSSYTTNTPAILKSALAVLTEIPYFLASILSTIWILVRRLRMPSFPSNWFRGVRYSQLNQDDYQDTGLQMDE